MAISFHRLDLLSIIVGGGGTPRQELGTSGAGQKTPESVFFTKLINDNLSHPHFIQDVSGDTLESFCDGSQDSLSFPRLMSKFKNMDHAQNIQRLCQRLAVLSDRPF